MTNNLLPGKKTTGRPCWQRIREHFNDTFSGDLVYRRRAFDAERIDGLLVQRQRDAYRYILLLLAFIVLPISTHNLYTGQTLPGVAGLSLLAIFVANIWLLSIRREAFLAPAMMLLLSLSLVLLSVWYGQHYSLFWLYPLLVALPLLLRIRWAICLGMLCALLVVPLLLSHFDRKSAAVLGVSMGLTWLASAWLVYAATEQARRLRQMANTDPLTGVFNRRYLELQMEQALSAWRRYRRPTTLLIIDVDHFKRINDRFGHAIGDHALRRLVELISARIRSVDTLCRYGGEEFVVLLREVNASGAAVVAEALRSRVEAAPVLPEGRMTVSIGIAELVEAEDLDHWLNLADAALYLAKRSGRNRVELAQSPVTPMAPRARTVPDWR